MKDPAPRSLGAGFMVMRRLIGLCLAIGLTGCTSARREDLVKEVVSADPAFAEVLDKHRELSNRLQTYQRELALKRTTIEQHIAQLRRDLATAAANVRTKTAETKKRMEPDRKRLTDALDNASDELRNRQTARAAVGRSIAQLRKTLKASDANTTAQERTARDAQLSEMVRDAARIDHETATLKEHVRLLKIKLLLIKL